jgi:peptidoglycan/xylan/chitin deacetylase (PgdA/CDA1 family)
MLCVPLYALALPEPTEDEDTRFVFVDNTTITTPAFTFEVKPLDHEVFDPPLYAATFSRERMPKPDDGKRIALTFDDGPSSYTTRILNALEQYGAKATFCVIGSRVSNYSSIIARADQMGCEVIGHSWSHVSLTSLTVAEIAEDIRRASSAIARVTGKTPKLFRPPYGNVNSAVREAAKRQGAAIIMWSVDTLDWSRRDADKVYNAIMAEASDGAIILCHDIYASTVEAVIKAVPELIRRGYQLVTVSELLGFDKEEATPGKSYFKK